MKIGQRLSLFYTGVTLVLTILVVLTFYLSASRAIDSIFFSSLNEKANLSTRIHLERDNLDTERYRLFEQQYESLLPEAKDILLAAELPQTLDSLRKYFKQSEIETLFTGQPVNFSSGKTQGTALYYPDNQGNFVVLVTAENEFGANLRKQLLLIMGLLLAGASLILFWIGRMYANHMLEPLQNILTKLKSIQGNKLEVRLDPIGNKDEFDDLILTVNEMLNRINEAFNAEQSFISNASHELNNPITAIQGECEITLLKKRSPEEYIESLQRISMESKRLSDLIRHLLFLSRQKGELLSNSVEGVDLAPFMEDLCQGNPRLRYDRSKWNKPELRVMANTYLLRVAIQNVLENACKYSGRKPVDVRLSERSGEIVLEVEDYGIGIPQEDIKNIFQSFYRAANTRGYAGYGIGLSLSFKILSIYNGRIEIESTPEIGTKVTIFCKAVLRE